ncbi:MAG: hypothetical protein EOO60_10900 [Hymenobacter sp.]|nr:MAG: hypothetical protein EOO60_10900 [Hymenobacter sp.]
MDLDYLFPLIVPSSYISETTWDLPHYQLPNKDFILTWVSFKADEAMVYLTRDEYQALETTQPSWQQVALDNLRHSSADDESFCTHVKVSDDERRLIFLAFMHQDGIGSSRLLLAPEWEQAFPKGYYLALPDRSCGLLVPRDITAAELADVKELVSNMHTGATIPMSDQLYPSMDFTLPAPWTESLDIVLSQAVVEAIKELTS